MMDKTIQSIIRAFLLDYPRRNTIAAEVGTIDNKNDRASISAFMAWNERIDKALTIIDEPFRVGMFQDIANGTGYHKSPLRQHLTTRHYYTAKNKVLESLARELNLI